MKRAIVVLSLMLMPLASQATIEEAELQEIVEGKYAQFNRALVGRNLGAFTALCTADCKFKLRPGGVPLSLDQFKRMRERGFKTITVVRAQTIVDSVAVQGDRATVNATWIAELSAKSGKATRNLRNVQKLQDAWSRIEDDWKLSNSVVRSTRTNEIPQAVRRR